MSNDLTGAKEHFVQGVSRIAHFWGFPKAMGAIYGAIYLSKAPLTLDDLVAEVFRADELQARASLDEELA